MQAVAHCAWTHNRYYAAMDPSCLLAVVQAFGRDATLMDTLDPEVRSDVEAAARLLSKRVAARCGTAIVNPTFWRDATIAVDSAWRLSLGSRQCREVPRCCSFVPFTRGPWNVHGIPALYRAAIACVRDALCVARAIPCSVLRLLFCAALADNWFCGNAAALAPTRTRRRAAPRLQKWPTRRP